MPTFRTRNLGCALLASCAAAAALCAPAQATKITGLTTTDQLFTFDSATPGTTTTQPALTGLNAGDTLLAIDRNPNDGKLYGVSAQSRVYSINEATNVATQDGPVLPELINPTTSVGFDFHPQGYARIVTDTDQNIYWQPGGFSQVQTDLAYVAGDPSGGTNPIVRSLAYTPSYPSAPTATAYGYDFNVDGVVRLGSVGGNPDGANTGKLFTVGFPGLIATGNSLGMDAAPDGTMFALLRTSNITRLYTVNTSNGSATLVAPIGTGTDTTRDIAVDPVVNNFKFSAVSYSASESGRTVTLTVERSQSIGFASVQFATSDVTATNLFDYPTSGSTVFFQNGESTQTIELKIRPDVIDESDETFNVTLSNPNGGRAGLVAPSTTSVQITDDDAGPPPSTAMIALTTTDELVTFNSTTPGTVSAPLTITGLVATDDLIGIDRRPATGQLYGLGKESRIYTIDESTGVATQVGTSPFSPPLAGPQTGFDFDPMTDRIRVVTSASGQNLEINPDTGAATAWSPLIYEGPPNAGMQPRITGMAFTDNVPGATAASLFGYEYTKDELARIGSPGGSPNPINGGATATIGKTAITASNSENLGMDAGTDGTVWGLIRSAGHTQLNIMNLTSGLAELVGDVGAGTPDIYRDIATPPVSNVIQLGATSVSAGEGAGTATVTATRSQTLGAATVQYATTDNSATAGSDYTATSGTLTFAAGEASKDIAIPVTDDSADEVAEDLTLTVSNPAGGIASLGTPTAAFVTIEDNDEAAQPPPRDTTKPVASTCHKKRQNMVKQKGVKACVRSNEAGPVRITGKLKVRGVRKAFTLVRKSGTVRPGAKTRLKLTLGKKGLRALRRARRGTATLKIRVRDAAGNATVLTRRVRHKPPPA